MGRWCSNEITRLILSGISLDDLVVKPHVSDSHPVLGERSSLVRANGRSRAERLDGLQVLDQAVLASHSLGRQRQTDGDGGQQTLGHVSDDDSNQEDDSIQPLVAKTQGNDEERHAQEDGHAGNQMDEMGNLASDWCLPSVQPGSQSGDTTHYRVVSDADDNSAGGTFYYNPINI